MTGLQRVYKILNWVPLVWLFLFYAFILRIVLGDFTKPFEKSARALDFQIHYAMIIIVKAILTIGVPLWILFTILLVVKNQWNARIERHGLFYFLALVSLIVLYFVDPGGYFKWFHEEKGFFHFIGNGNENNK